MYQSSHKTIAIRHTITNKDNLLGFAEYIQCRVPYISQPVLTGKFGICWGDYRRRKIISIIPPNIRDSIS